MIVTVFTPTYNRAYILPKLYESLCAQSSMNFEWLVVDDGSTDNTESMVAGFMSQGKLRIRYIRQENGGKHRAINRGVSEAQGELFFVVDSDDQLTPDAIEYISTRYLEIAQDDSICGIAGFRAYLNGEIIGSNNHTKELVCNLLDYRFRDGYRGDRPEIYKTAVLQNYAFEDIEGENFATEALMFYDVSGPYKLLFTTKVLYLCEYLADGLTSASVRLRKKNIGYSLLYYSKLFGKPIPYPEKLKACINYLRFGFNIPSRLRFRTLFRMLPYTLIAIPVGFLMYLNDKRR